MTQTMLSGVADPAALEQIAPGLAEGPLETKAGEARAGQHIIGLCSLEKFYSVSGLSYTHEDAQGFRDWLAKWNHVPNFWFKDDAVKVWAYEETYDNWQDTYGFDADLVSYHSGHGAMDSNGVFYAPLGGLWDNRSTAQSNRMALGNEYCRYLFWSTCLSLRVRDGHTPIRTWHGANKGLRMIFGFETVSWDDPNYGKNFGKHWDAGKSLGTAWLDGSWDIAHDQSPSVVACGATQQEAQDRVFNERNFTWATVSNAWYWWRSYTPRAAMRERNLLVPSNPLTGRLAPASARSLRAAAERFGFDADSLRPAGSLAVTGDGRRRLTINADGTLIAQLAEHNRGNRTPIDRSAARSAAADIIQQYGLDADGPLVLDRIADVDEAGQSESGSGSQEGPFRTGTLVQFRQVIGDLPVITPGAGTVRVLIDNDGTPISVTANTRTVEDTSERSTRAPSVEPTPDGTEPRPRESSSPERLLARELSGLLQRTALRGEAPIGIEPVPGTYEVGYDIQDDQAVLVAQRAVELDFGEGFRKRYWIKAPITG